MNANRKIWLGAALASSLALGGCGGGDDKEFAVTPVPPPVVVVPPPVVAEVPDSAGASVGAFIAYLVALANNETSEPLGLKPGFTAPVNDTGEPQVLT